MIAGRRQLVAQVTAGQQPLVLKHPLALMALAALPGEFTRESALAAWDGAGIAHDAAEHLWDAFAAVGLVVDEPAEPSWWEELGWREACAYHRATRDYPFVQYDERGAFERDQRRMERYREEDESPPSYQRRPADMVVELPRWDELESPDEWLARMPEEERRGRAGIGLLLDVCFGERGHVVVAGGGRCLLKSIPSGGARHPTEVFLAAFELDGITPGIYHYDVQRHRLERVRAGQHRSAFAHATHDLFAKHDTPPSGALVFTSLVERAMWRYRDPRSFRAILVDVGHAVMAYRRVARMLGYRTYSYQKMRDSEVAELLCLDRFSQPPLYVGTLV